MLLILTFNTVEERDKFEYLYSKYKNLMLHKAYGVLHDYMLAEDAVSEAMLRIYKNLHKIDDPATGRSASFVVTVVKNVALTMLQKETRVEQSELTDDLREESYDLEQEVLSGLTSESILSLLDQIGDELRHVFVLKYAHDLSHKEIGKALGITENNVTVRLHRAKKKLSEILAREGYAGGKG